MNTSGPTPVAPYRDAAQLQRLLEQIYTAPQTGENLLTRHRLAVGFVFSGPDLTATVDGRSGQEVVVSFGEDLPPPDLSFSMNGQTAHAFWSGSLNLMTAMGLGHLKLQGSVIDALKIAPMMAALQQAYRTAWAEQDDG